MRNGSDCAEHTGVKTGAGAMRPGAKNAAAPVAVRSSRLLYILGDEMDGLTTGRDETKGG